MVNCVSSSALAVYLFFSTITQTGSAVRIVLKKPIYHRPSAPAGDISFRLSMRTAPPLPHLPPSCLITQGDDIGRCFLVDYAVFLTVTSGSLIFPLTPHSHFTYLQVTTGWRPAVGHVLAPISRQLSSTSPTCYVLPTITSARAPSPSLVS